jgi:hypothetical protein
VTRRAEQCYQWKGGRNISGGYVLVYAPDHPRAIRRRVLEHVLVVEKAMGKYLDPKHPIHHVDEDGTNNHPSNLVVCEDHAYHKLLHARQRALGVCGNPNAHPCRFCGQYDRQDEIRKAGRAWHHRSCVNSYERDRQRQKRVRIATTYSLQIK